MRQPYLPRKGEEWQLGSPEAALLDRQFRLTREDMMRPLTTSIKALLSLNDESESSGKVNRPLPPDIQRNTFPISAFKGVTSQPRPCLKIAIWLPDSHRAARLAKTKEREAFWKDFGRNTLPLDSLVCLVSQPKQQGGKPLLFFATVARRDIKELASEAPVVGLALYNKQDVEKVSQLIGQQGARNSDQKQMMLIQVRGRADAKREPDRQQLILCLCP